MSHICLCPIAILSYDTPRTLASHQYTIDFPGIRVLEFNCTYVQLSQLDWKRYLEMPDPVAIALISKTPISPEDRPHAIRPSIDKPPMKGYVD